MKQELTLAVTAATDTSTSNIANVTPEIWSQDLAIAASNVRVARQLCEVKTELDGVGDVYHLMTGAGDAGQTNVASHTETTEPTYNEITTYSSVDLTPSWTEIGACVSLQVVEEVGFDLLRDITRQLGEGLAQKEDVDILGTATTGFAPTTRLTDQNTVYGGDATTIGTLADGDLITTDLVVDGITLCREDAYNPDHLLIHYQQENVFLKDSQFMNAAEYGGDDVILNGQIGKTYAGQKVIVSQNIFANIGDSGGHNCFLVQKDKGGVIAQKRAPSVESEYVVREGSHYIVAREAYAFDVKFPKSTCQIIVTDA